MNFQITLFKNFGGREIDYGSQILKKVFILVWYPVQNTFFDKKIIFWSKWCLASDLAKKPALFEFSNYTFLKKMVVEK